MAALRELSRKTRATLAARRNGADQHPLANFVAAYARTQFFNHAHRFVANHETRFNGILPADDVQIGPADGRERDADDCFAKPSVRARNFFDPDIVHSVEDCRSHLFHIRPPVYSKCSSGFAPITSSVTARPGADVEFWSLHLGRPNPLSFWTSPIAHATPCKSGRRQSAQRFGRLPAPAREIRRSRSE